MPETSPPVPLLILSDVRLYREGLRLSIATRTTGIQVISGCGNTDEVIGLLARYPRAIVLVDIGTVRGMSDVRRIAAASPKSTVLALGLAPETDEEIVAAAEAGVAGFVPPDGSLDDLIRVIEHAARGELLCSPRVAGTLVRRIASLASTRYQRDTSPALTSREMEVLELLDLGLTNKQIARRLSIRLATVKNHVHSILAKLNVKRRGEAVAAIRGDGLATIGGGGDGYSRWSGSA